MKEKEGTPFRELELSSIVKMIRGGMIDEVVSVRKCAAERGAFHSVRHIWRVPWLAGNCRRVGPWRIRWRHPLVVHHDPEFARVGSRIVAFCVSVPAETIEVRGDI